MDYRKLLLVLLVLGNAAYANATSVDLRFVNVGPGYHDNYYYVYPYKFSVNGSSDLTSLLCDDFTDDVYFGESWKATVNRFSDILSGQGQMAPQGGLVDNGNRVKAYKNAAWLYQQLMADPSQSNSISINHTIWALFAATPFNHSDDVAFWFEAAKSATSNLSDAQAINQFGNLVFYTPIAGTWNSTYGRPQEFIGSVAEPSSLMLLGTALVGFGIVRRRGRI
jgi:hypothetical protein